MPRACTVSNEEGSKLSLHYMKSYAVYNAVYIERLDGLHLIAINCYDVPVVNWYLDNGQVKNIIANYHTFMKLFIIFFKKKLR